jgi:hypothetical protein
LRAGAGLVVEVQGIGWIHRLQCDTGAGSKGYPASRQVIINILFKSLDIKTCFLEALWFDYFSGNDSGIVC